MSKEFKALYKKDQYHTKRWSKQYTDKEYFKINKKLCDQCEKLIRKGISDPYDYFVASIIFHHASKITYSKKALSLAKKALKLGYKDKSMIAAITDRLLQLQGKPQKYGTQYVETKNGWKLYRYDKKTTDAKRKESGVPKLKELKRMEN